MLASKNRNAVHAEGWRKWSMRQTACGRSWPLLPEIRRGLGFGVQGSKRVLGVRVCRSRPRRQETLPMKTNTLRTLRVSYLHYHIWQAKSIAETIARSLLPIFGSFAQHRPAPKKQACKHRLQGILSRRTSKEGASLLELLITFFRWGITPTLATPRKGRKVVVVRATITCGPR